MNICKDCKHCERSLAGVEFSKCKTQTDPVTGRAKHYCGTMRRGASVCGPAGKLFEPREPFSLLKFIGIKKEEK